MTKLPLLRLAMIELLQAPWCALGWGRAFGSSRCLPLHDFIRRSLKHRSSRSGRGYTRPFRSNVGVHWASGSSSPGEVAVPKGEYHLLPRLYVGVEPTLQTIEFRATNRSCLVEQTNGNPTLPPLLDEMSQIQLTEAQSHYLTSVIRLLKRRKDEPLVRLFDGRSGEWLARVRADDKESGDEDGVMRKKKHKNRSLLHVECLSLLRPQQKSRLSPCWLCVPAPASKERLRWMLEKATELNVDRIVFLETDYSASTQSKAPGSLRKAHAYLVEAAEQAERLTLPAFVRLLPALTETTTAANTSSKSYDLDERDVVTTRLSDLLDFVRGEPTLRLLVCRERTPAASSVSLWQALVDSHRQENVEPAAIAFCIGPEGGWSPNEESHLDELEAQYPGSVINVSLGPTVLRVETAAISALAAHNCFCDDRVHRS